MFKFLQELFGTGSTKSVREEIETVKSGAEKSLNTSVDSSLAEKKVEKPQLPPPVKAVTEEGLDIYLFVEYGIKLLEPRKEGWQNIPQIDVLGKKYDRYGDSAPVEEWLLLTLMNLVLEATVNLDYDKDRMAIVVTGARNIIAQSITGEQDKLEKCIYQNRYEYDLENDVNYTFECAPYQELYQMSKEEQRKYPKRKQIGIIVAHSFISKHVPENECRYEEWFAKCKEAGIEIFTMGLKVSDEKYMEELNVPRLKGMSTRKDQFCVGDYNEIKSHLFDVVFELAHPEFY